MIGLLTARRRFVSTAGMILEDVERFQVEVHLHYPVLGEVAIRHHGVAAIRR